MVRNIYRFKKSIVEISVDSNGFNFLVIFGKHINGYFIAIPNHNICVEASAAKDTFYNIERLIGVAGLNETEASDIANAIAAVVGEIEQNEKGDKP